MKGYWRPGAGGYNTLPPTSKKRSGDPMTSSAEERRHGILEVLFSTSQVAAFPCFLWAQSSETPTSAFKGWTPVLHQNEQSGCEEHNAYKIACPQNSYLKKQITMSARYYDSLADITSSKVLKGYRERFEKDLALWYVPKACGSQWHKRGASGSLSFQTLLTSLTG